LDVFKRPGLIARLFGEIELAKRRGVYYTAPPYLVDIFYEIKASSQNDIKPYRSQLKEIIEYYEYSEAQKDLTEEPFVPLSLKIGKKASKTEGKVQQWFGQLDVLRT